MLVALVLNVFLVRSTYASIKAVVDSTEKKCVVEEQYFRVITRKYNASVIMYSNTDISAFSPMISHSTYTVISSVGNS